MAGVKAGCVHLCRVAGNTVIPYGKWHSVAVSWNTSINSYIVHFLLPLAVLKQWLPLSVTYCSQFKLFCKVLNLNNAPSTWHMAYFLLRDTPLVQIDCRPWKLAIWSNSVKIGSVTETLICINRLCSYSVCLVTKIVHFRWTTALSV